MNEFCIFGIQFSSREVALFSWSLVFIVLAARRIDVRKSFFAICRSFLNWKILVPIFAIAAYSLMIVFVLYKLGIWQPFLIKDTIYWFIGTAFILLLNINEADQNGFFKKVLIDSLRVIVLFIFIINLYTLNIFIELILVPLVFFIVVMSTYVEGKPEYFQIKRILNFGLSAIGILYIFYAVCEIFSDYRLLVNVKNLETFILPPILTVTFIPVLYLLALIAAYEVLFMRLGIFIKNDPELLHFSKMKIFQLCHFNLFRLNRFARDGLRNFMGLDNKSDVLKTIGIFEKKKS